MAAGATGMMVTRIAEQLIAENNIRVNRAAEILQDEAVKVS